MDVNPIKQEWLEYCKRELEIVTPPIQAAGFSIDAEQVHISGERYLMTSSRDVGGGGKKLVLLGKRISDNIRVVIKTSTEKKGIEEIRQERNARNVLKTINFAYRNIHTAEEIFFLEKSGIIISITVYIEQDRAFMSRGLDEQFFLALRAFETQEGVHLTTYSHSESVKHTFEIADGDYYIRSFASFKEHIEKEIPDSTNLIDTITKGAQFLTNHKSIIDRYCGFLTHSDFVPNNLRVSGNELYLLDYGSIHFGNKYESWARFLNFMVHHNRPLEIALTQYVKDNRSGDGYLSLRLMRVYKIGFLLQFYSAALKKTSGNLHELIQLRIQFWITTMQSILEDTVVPIETVTALVEAEDRLRTSDEKKRQEEMIGGKRSV